MSGVEGLLIPAVLGFFTNLSTKGIDPLLERLWAAQRCQQECQKLADSVVKIQRDVQHIVGQFQELERYDAGARHDLCVVTDAVHKLTKELELAGLDVHECDSASKFGKKLGGLGGHSSLSKRITKRNECITGLADSVLVQTNLSLTAMLGQARRSTLGAHQYQGNPNLQQHHQMFAHQSSLDLQQWRRDVDDILQREDSTRDSQRLQRVHSASSSHGSSPLYADDSNHHSFHSLNHDTHHIMLHRSNTIASTHQHDVPDFHRSFTVPRCDHVTHSEPGEQVLLQDPFVPQLQMYI